MSECEKRPKAKPNLRDIHSNWWDSDLPFFEKLRVAMENNFTKLRKLEDCCGNLGQPGC